MAIEGPDNVLTLIPELQEGTAMNEIAQFFVEVVKPAFAAKPFWTDTETGEQYAIGTPDPPQAVMQKMASDLGAALNAIAAAERD